MAVIPVQYARFVHPPSPAFPHGRTASRPIVRITLRAGIKHLTCYAMVDSGADHCVFPRSFLAPLGLDALSGPVEMSQGMGSSNVPTLFFDVSIDLQGLIRFPVYAGFTSGLDLMGIGLLGQAGFFDRFNVTFKLAQGIYEIEPI